MRRFNRSTIFLTGLSIFSTLAVALICSGTFSAVASTDEKVTYVYSAADFVNNASTNKYAQSMNITKESIVTVDWNVDQDVGFALATRNSAEHPRSDGAVRTLAQGHGLHGSFEYTTIETGDYVIITTGGRMFSNGTVTASISDGSATIPRDLIVYMTAVIFLAIVIGVVVLNKKRRKKL